MATKNEKAFGLIGGIFIGFLSGKSYLKNHGNIQENDKWKYLLVSSLGGGLIGYSISSVFGSPNNTVNYSLYNGKKRVYDGITFEDRIGSRKLEHIKSGKKFTKMLYDNAKPRIEALKLEKKLIKKYKPIYNIQHNS